MDKELFVIIRRNMIPSDLSVKPRLYTKKQAEDALNGRVYDEDRHTLCRLVPCSVSEEPITVTKKVIV